MVGLTRWLRHRLQGEPSADMVVRRELDRIADAPRYTPLTTEVMGFRFDLVDGPSFRATYHSIIERSMYAFDSPSVRPYIIDCGANVGLSIVFFKRRFAAARVLAFEADPNVFEVLSGNIRRSGFADVELVNKAVWTQETDIEFWQEGADAGRISRIADREFGGRVSVAATRLRDYLSEPIDLLKLDIEGAETDVLLDCEDRLINARRLFVEYHSFVGEEQRLDQLLRTLKAAGFRVFVQTEICPPQPFLSSRPYLGMDLQLNIFGCRSAGPGADAIALHS